MDGESQFQYCAHGVIEGQKDMPRWGQLGCNGLIILDGNKATGSPVISPCTSAFQQVRDLAFRHVEELISDVAADKSLSPAYPGDFVFVKGLKKRSDLNGKHGLFIGTANQENTRKKIKLLEPPNFVELSVKPVNIERLPQANQMEMQIASYLVQTFPELTNTTSSTFSASSASGGCGDSGG